MGGDGTARPAVSADSIDFFCHPRPSLLRPEFAGKGARRADGHALTAELTVEVILIGSADLGLEPAVTEIYRLDALYLVAGLDAPAAEDALFKVTFNEGVA